MIAYADTSALVKRYVTEPESDETLELTATADVVATSLVSRAEVAAALACCPLMRAACPQRVARYQEVTICPSLPSAPTE